MCEIDEKGNEKRYDVFSFEKSGGVILAMYNTDEVGYSNIVTTHIALSLVRIS